MIEKNKSAQTKDRLLHYVNVTVFSKPSDDDKAVRAGLDKISPMRIDELLAIDKEYDPEKPKTVHHRAKDVELTVTKTEVDDGHMIIYKLFFKKIHDVNKFCKMIVGAMIPSEKLAYKKNPLSLVDDDWHLSLRLDKTLLMSGTVALTKDGNCYQVKAAIAAYPRTKEGIIAAIEKILQD